MIFSLLKSYVPSLVGRMVSELSDEDDIIDWKEYSGIFILLFFRE